MNTSLTLHSSISSGINISSLDPEYVTSIPARRTAFCDSLVPVVQQYYAEISGAREQVGIEYRSDLQKGDLREICRENSAAS